MPPPSKLNTQPAGLNLQDVLFILFKHKWKILLSAIAGIIGAAAVYLLQPPLYESQAKLLVRYVVDRSAIDPVDSAQKTGLTSISDSVINSEVEILTSWDLAVQVAEAIGVQRLSPGATSTNVDAARSISMGLEVTALKGTNVIIVSYKNRDPGLATHVLNELVNRYFNKHLEIHRSGGAFDFVTQQTDQVRSRLSQTEDELKRLKTKEGIISLAESTANLNTEMARTQGELRDAETQMAEKQARVREMGKSFTALSLNQADTKKSEAKMQLADTGEVQQYQALVTRLAQLRQTELDLLFKYTPENQFVKLNQAQIEEVENQRRDMEKKFPGLVARASAKGFAQDHQTDLISEETDLAAIQAKTEALKAQLHDVQEQARHLAEAAPQIAQLEREKELEDANYKYFGASLEKARIDEALDPSKIPNISTVQKASPAFMATTKRNKVVLGLAGGGMGFGIALALFIELVLNRTIKRPLELETQLHIPLLLSIPDVARNGQARTAQQHNIAQKSSTALDRKTRQHELLPWELGHFIRPFSEAIRDHLGLYFDLNDLTHKPKLVAVTGFSKGGGTSTIAGGLAAALSETGDGKVLLVDMNVGSAEMHPFFQGKPAYSLQAALQPAGSIDSAADNLYLATGGPGGTGIKNIGLKRFHALMPNLKASDFDYIIFDMPPVSQTSPTASVAGFMDKVLLVVEAEKCHRDTVKRGYAQMTANKANVSIVFNKTHSYAPKWVEGELS